MLRIWDPSPRAGGEVVCHQVVLVCPRQYGLTCIEPLLVNSWVLLRARCITCAGRIQTLTEELCVISAAGFMSTPTPSDCQEARNEVVISAMPVTSPRGCRQKCF